MDSDRKIKEKIKNFCEELFNEGKSFDEHRYNKAINNYKSLECTKIIGTDFPTHDERNCYKLIEKSKISNDDDFKIIKNEYDTKKCNILLNGELNKSIFDKDLNNIPVQLLKKPDIEKFSKEKTLTNNINQNNLVPIIKIDKKSSSESYASDPSFWDLPNNKSKNPNGGNHLNKLKTTISNITIIDFISFVLIAITISILLNMLIIIYVQLTDYDTLIKIFGMLFIFSLIFGLLIIYNNESNNYITNIGLGVILVSFYELYNVYLIYSLKK